SCREHIPAIFAPGAGLIATIDNGCGGEPSALDVPRPDPRATARSGSSAHWPCAAGVSMCRPSSTADAAAQTGQQPRGQERQHRLRNRVDGPGNTTLLQRVVGFNREWGLDLANPQPD